MPGSRSSLTVAHISTTSRSRASSTSSTGHCTPSASRRRRPRGMTDSRAPGAVIISGGSRGLGRALVDSLRADGSAVATFSRGEPAGVEAWRDDPRVLWQQLDATDYDALSGFVKSVEHRFGRV